MSEEAKLERAFAATAAPKRDTAFVIAVLERAEAERYRTERARKVLTGAGLAAGAAGLAALAGAWLTEQPPTAMTGAVLAVALGALVFRARNIASRLAWTARR